MDKNTEKIEELEDRINDLETEVQTLKERLAGTSDIANSLANSDYMQS